MELNFRYLPPSVGEWELTRILAKEILHNDDFQPLSNPDDRRLNFRVSLNPSKAGGIRSDGTGVLTLPHPRIGYKFLDWVNGEKPLKVDGKKVKFWLDKKSKPKSGVIMALQRTPYIDPDVEEAHAKKIFDLDTQIRVDTVQSGLFFRPFSPVVGGKPIPREFSIEWSKAYVHESSAWLKFEYDHKLIRISLGNSMTEHNGYSIAIPFASIMKIGIGNDPAAYACFDLLVPPIFETEEFYRTIVGDPRIDGKKFRHRVGSLDEAHLRVAPYCHKLRITMCDNDPRQDIVQNFRRLCKIADLADSLIIKCAPTNNIEAANHSFFAHKTLYKLHQKINAHAWPIAFQLECLLHNGLLHSGEIEQLIPYIHNIPKSDDSQYLSSLLRTYNTSLPDRPPNVNFLQFFEQIRAKFRPNEFSLPRGNFNCGHVTFTPTRILLEGPYPTQTNRIIRKYAGFEDHFVRVDFRDEDRLQYRWDREVDGRSFLEERVGGTLKNGFSLGGRNFHFLAYSNSALRQHAVWFMSPFYHDQEGREVTPDSIRDSIGDFKNLVEEDYGDEERRFYKKDKELLKQPSKYAARIAQAFTATDPSVSIGRDEWEMMEDIEDGIYLFTDGVGTISEALGDRIWDALCRDRGYRSLRSIKPSAYQIRFLGFKGVVSVDRQLDKAGGKICMRLRPSMRKFGNRSAQQADIEIARAFERPNLSHLNRPLVTVLEGRGVKKEAFTTLLDLAMAEVYSVDGSIEKAYTFMRDHGLGSTFNLPWILQQLEQMKCYIGDERERPSKHHVNIDRPFLEQLREVARMDVLRDMKHQARIPIPDSYLLVGVADEGPTYQKAGHENVYTLPEGRIFACIHHPGQDPTYLEGTCTISRSPVAHPGDVQRVHAIGKPPSGMLCTFEHLKNVVVLPTVGKRSLASCLGGGDLDGDEYSIITYPPLLPTENEKPASYEAGGTLTLERESNIQDVCNFIVEYVNSDVIGLVSDRLIVIADQSKDGIYDKDCLKLAKLCSQAVDYPKNGIPVDLEKDKLPPTLIRPKPDWHAAEIVNPRGTDYYESTRALGELYRKIKLKESEETVFKLEKRLEETQEPTPAAGTTSNAKPISPPSDPLSLVLRDNIRAYYNPSEETDVQQLRSAVETTFLKYRDELRYICSIHTLSNTPGVRLLEAEVVAGTILAKCSQRRYRQDRMFRMRTHASMLVKEVTAALSTPPSDPSSKKNGRGQESSPEQIERKKALHSLKLAWWAWDFSLRRTATGNNEDRFGGHSFGFIALDCILHALEELDKLDLQVPGEAFIL